MKILVTGGSGYIGSITVRRLVDQGHEVVVYDNLLYGHKESLKVPLIVGDLMDKEFLFQSFADTSFDAVIHFAAYALAGESMQDPYKYFSSNIQGGLNLLEFMQQKKIPVIIFSSTCAIYGTPQNPPVKETSPKQPESVYGASKLQFEQILEWYEKIYGIRFVNLRYFNAAGASLDGSLGEQHTAETHIIPLAMKAAKEGKPFTIFGNDYPTPDKTCIRDYIHVEDLAVAHIQALEWAQKEKRSGSFNIGTGKGYSNREVVDRVKKVSGIDFSVSYGARRVGDPPIIYADPTFAREMLGFTPKFSDLQTIIETAWKWHSNEK